MRTAYSRRTDRDGPVVAGLRRVAALLDGHHQAAVCSSGHGARAKPAIDHGREGREEQVRRRRLRGGRNAKGVAKQLSGQTAGARGAPIVQALECREDLLLREGPVELCRWPGQRLRRRRLPRLRLRLRLRLYL